MIAVEEALARILAAMPSLPAETVGLREALGRVLAEPVIARVTQPPSAVSAMDGYAVRAQDVAETPITLTRTTSAPRASTSAPAKRAWRRAAGSPCATSVWPRP